jgi:hypothetical protein
MENRAWRGISVFSFDCRVLSMDLFPNQYDFGINSELNKTERPKSYKTDRILKEIYYMVLHLKYLDGISKWINL